MWNTISDANSNVYCDPDTLADCNPDSVVGADSDCDPNADAGADPDRDPDPNAFCHAYSDFDIYDDANADTDAVSLDSDFDSDPHSNSDLDSNSNSDFDSNSDSDSNSNSDSEPFRAGDSDSVGNSDRHADADTDANPRARLYSGWETLAAAPDGVLSERRNRPVRYAHAEDHQFRQNHPERLHRRKRVDRHPIQRGVSGGFVVQPGSQSQSVGCNHIRAGSVAEHIEAGVRRNTPHPDQRCQVS